jgi:hypothetical protein
MHRLLAIEYMVSCASRHFEKEGAPNVQEGRGPVQEYKDGKQEEKCVEILYSVHRPAVPVLRLLLDCYQSSQASTEERHK